MVVAYLVFLGLVALERLVELTISRRHADWALKNGGKEYGKEHFGLMKILHTGFLVSCAAEVIVLERPFLPQIGLPMLALVLAAQGLRYWCIFTLGRFWSVRVIVVPGSDPVTKGPYRYLRHPNYLAVIIEGVAIPMIHTAWVTAVVFTVLNAWLLRTRIRCEEEALAAHGSYRERLGNLPRLFPRRRSLTQP